MAINKNYTFSNNTIADPAEVNQNFDDLIAAIKAAHHRDVDGTKISYQDIASGWGLIPAGAVILWNGLISAIPTGYVFCNGANGTQDMRAKFVIGAGQDSGGTYDTFSTGGASTINIYHDHTTAGHAITTAEMAYHNHADNGHGHSAWTDAGGSVHTHGAQDGVTSILMRDDSNANETYGTNDSTSGNNRLRYASTTGAAGSHTHGVGIGTGYASISYSGSNAAHYHGNTGANLSAGQGIIPPYIAMVWIQKT